MKQKLKILEELEIKYKDIKTIHQSKMEEQKEVIEKTKKILLQSIL
ncbi:MAG: hypothetical protein ACLU2J_05105 [Clostridia bacterium]